MEDSAYMVVFITTADDEEAQLISRVLLEQKKAACVNIVNDISSLFWWKGKIDSAEESLLIVKTQASLLDDIIELVKEIHSYENPEIIALPILGGSQAYLEWIDKALEGSG